jgi:hypothetical protein
MKVTSVFIKYLNYACKITWIEFLITLCLVKNSIQISKRKHSVTSRFIWEAYKQLELVSHRDIRTLENNVWKHSRFALVFSYIVFSCLDIPVKHSLSLFIYYVVRNFLTYQIYSSDMIELFTEVYNWLPLAHLINSKVMVCEVMWSAKNVSTISNKIQPRSLCEMWFTIMSFSRSCMAAYSVTMT